MGKNRKNKTAETTVSDNNQSTPIVQIDEMTVPSRGRGRTPSSPFSLALINLKQASEVNGQLVGESFLAPLKKYASLSVLSSRRNFSLVTRKEGDQMRVWKIAYREPRKYVRTSESTVAPATE